MLLLLPVETAVRFAEEDALDVGVTVEFPDGIATGNGGIGLNVGASIDG